MIERIHCRVASLALAGALLIPEASAPAQQTPNSLADRPLATRQALEALEGQLAAGAGAADGSTLARVRARLQAGDFREGDLVLLEVQNEPALSDTFTVGPDVELTLPSPTVGSLSLKGVLRSELQREVQTYLGRFILDPVCRATPLLRLSVQGEVARAGFHGVPANAVLAEALMAAGGTTPQADLHESLLERNSEEILDGKALQRAIAAGHTLDDLSLRDGDQIIVARRDDDSLYDRLRFVLVVVSVAGGIYGLSQAF